ncbi:hypothetical protein CPB84DRAFT_185370 [Gymnopilus junonius]|uniref:Uncharacterized protein n=1 Tax=Gymnopilus junonius TaxID=109634 RepID=A0A9P5NEW5_GYMJU|nr:hypothetical protein CPB84DRAFT_185370 [Gymnopilus junonius]
MLAWRTISRPATTRLRPRYQISGRSFHLSAPRTQGHIYPSRGSGFLAKARCRPDGEPRSLWVGSASAAVGVLTLYLLWMCKNVLFYEVGRNGILAIACILHTDTGYSNVDFEDPRATLKYYRKLIESHTMLPTRDIDSLFDELVDLLHKRGEKLTGTMAHDIMRTAARNIHDSFQKLAPESMGQVIREVSGELTNSMAALNDVGRTREDDRGIITTIRLDTSFPYDSERASDGYEGLG